MLHMAIMHCRRLRSYEPCGCLREPTVMVDYLSISFALGGEHFLRCSLEELLGILCLLSLWVHRLDFISLQQFW